MGCFGIPKVENETPKMSTRSEYGSLKNPTQSNPQTCETKPWSLGGFKIQTLPSATPKLAFVGSGIGGPETGSSNRTNICLVLLTLAGSHT